MRCILYLSCGEMRALGGGQKFCQFSPFLRCDSPNEVALSFAGIYFKMGFKIFNGGLVKNIFYGILLFTCVTSYAADSTPVLNDVTYHVQVSAWATSDKAAVVIAVDAIAKGQDVVETQQKILEKLKKLDDKQTWNIVELDRNQDQSGLEKLHLVVTAQLSQNQLNNLRNRIQALSIPGEQFDLQTIDFQPSLSDIEETKNELRQQIYQEVKVEVEQLNKIYSKQHYFLHSINFMGDSIYPLTGTALLRTPTPQQNMAIKRKINLDAVVVLSSQ